jgi:hypothetical protein
MVANLAEAKNHPVTPEAFLKHDTYIRTAKREQEDASAELARTKKAAKQAAVNPLAYKIIEMIRKLDDDEQPIVVRTFLQYATWLDMPIGTQASLMDAPKVPKPKAAAKAEHSVWAAGEAGLQAGRDGDGADANPCSPGSEHYVAWSKKHTRGLTERATAASMLNTEVERVADNADATRKAGQGRGRRGGVAARAAQARDNALNHLNGSSSTTN